MPPTKTGPKPRCLCGECPLCRQRERVRRKRHGEPPLPPKRHRALQLRLPADPAVLGYMAGLLDGEGCISEAGNPKGWRITIAMTDKPVIDWLGSFGGGTVTTDHRRENYGRKTLWRWRLMRSRDVLVFLQTLRPYLRVKQDRADEAIADIVGRLAVAA